MPQTFAMILAGGGGTRLWPASRRRRPKQLLSLGAPESLLAATARRARALVGPEHVLVVTAADQEALIRAELPELPHENILAEPEPRNTAGAVGVGAAFACRHAGPSSVLAVLPADHSISDEAGFEQAARAALRHARETIVTIGIRPTHPETGFGYIRLGLPVATSGQTASDACEAFQVAAFVEKPDHATAERYVASGEYVWNAGMFFFSAGRMLDEARQHLPALGLVLDELVAAKDFGATLRERYGAVPAISIDYGVMEKASGLRVVPAEFGWNDVGSWAALAAIRKLDARENVLVGAATLIDGARNVIVSEPGAPYVGVVGVSDTVIVATADAVLVIPKDRAQDVRQIVEAAKAAGRSELL